MGISSVLSRVLPVAVGYATGGPAGAAKAAYETEAQKKAEARAKRNFNRDVAEQERLANMDPFLQSYTGGTSVPTIRQAPTTQNAGFGSGFGTFLGDVGRNILGPIGNIFNSPALTPFVTAQSRGQPAQPSQGGQMGQESARSGTQEAFIGGVPNILGQAARFLRTPGGQVGTGLIGGIGASMLGGSSPGMRITRKMKSQYRSVLNLNGGNYQAAADMLGVSDDFFIAVMLKRFRNDGAVVTKAALRKTKTTVRRLKSMCDMYDSLRPTATRRRSPMKRSTTTLIKN
jgi:hypothetical protein